MSMAKVKTTDNQKELFDWVDENDKVIGQITRRQAHTNPKHIHRSTGIFLFNDRDELFMQKRSLTKDMGPGTWTLSASGHLLTGQNYIDAATREVEEELGVIINKKDLTWLGKILIWDGSEREIASFFKAYHKGPFKLNPVEVDQGRWFSLLDLEQEIEQEKIILSKWSMVNLFAVYGILQKRQDLKKMIVKRFK